MKRCSFLRDSQRVKEWRLGERAPGKVKIWGFGGRSFSFDNRPDRVGRKWLEEKQQSLLSRGGAVSGAVGFGVFGKAACFNFWALEGETGAVETKPGQDPPEGGGRCSWSRGCLEMGTVALVDAYI